MMLENTVHCLSPYLHRFNDKDQGGKTFMMLISGCGTEETKSDAS